MDTVKEVINYRAALAGVLRFIFIERRISYSIIILLATMFVISSFTIKYAALV